MYQVYSETYHDVWRRDKKIHECYICGAYTNVVKVSIRTVKEEFYSQAHSEERGGEIYCPNERKRWHSEIWDKLELLFEKPHPEVYWRGLFDEILATRKHNKPKDDVKGVKLSKKPVWIKPIDADEALWRKFAPLLRRENIERK